MGKRENQRKLALDLLDRVEECNTEAELEEVSDLVEELVQIGKITKKQYKAIDEALDDRLSYLVCEGII